MVDRRTLTPEHSTGQSPPAVDQVLQVLVISPWRKVWGAERSILGLAPLLRARGVELTLGSPGGGDLCEAWSSTGLPHIEIDLPAHNGIRSAAGGRPGARALAGELHSTFAGARLVARASRSVDVIHSNSLWGHLDCALGGRLARRPVVLELHDLIRPGAGRYLLKVAMGLSSGVMAISAAVAETAGGSGVGSGGRFRVVPQGVDAERFHPGPPDPDLRARLSGDPTAPLVGIVGRIDPGKGVDIVVEAVASLGGSAGKCRLAVIGGPGLDTGDYEQHVRSVADRLLGDRVRFTGPIDDIPGALRSLDVLVNASAAEPFGLSVLEAQATGVAVVATDAGGIPEFVTDGVTGLLIAPGDAEALRAALERLIVDPELRYRLARSGRSAVEDRYRLDARADAVAAMYRSVVRGR